MTAHLQAALEAGARMAGWQPPAEWLGELSQALEAAGETAQALARGVRVTVDNLSVLAPERANLPPAGEPVQQTLLARALVRTGDRITVDVPARRLHLEVSDAELARRRAAWTAPTPPARGWYKLYVDHVQQANLGADLDFLVGGSGAPVPRDSH